DGTQLHEIRPVERGPGGVRDDDTSIVLATQCYLARKKPAPGGGFGQGLLEPAPGDVVREREALGVLPDEAHESGALAAEERNDVATPPARRDPRHVADESDAADDGGRRDRAA